MENQSFSIRESFIWAFNAFKSNAMNFIAVTLISIIPYFLIHLMALYIGDQTFKTIFMIVFIFLYYVIQIGCIKYYINFYNFNENNFGILFSQFHKTHIIIFASVCTSISVIIGFFLFFIPGIYISLATMFFPFIIADKSVGAIDSIKHSFLLTKGELMNLFVLIIALIFFNIIGIMLFIIGILITTPITFLILTYIYKSLFPKIEYLYEQTANVSLNQ